jgi:hypothetical protein
MLENGLETCTCKRNKCERFGDCAACIEHHTHKRNKLPYCKRMEEKQRSKSVSKKELKA